MRKILVVDDESSVRYGIRRALEGNYQISEAGSAAEARKAIVGRVNEHPDVILLDLVMPDESGLSFLKWLRENNHAIPVLIVSALDSAKTAVEALQNGARD